MSFGKNPHVAKAQTAEQKAADAVDLGARAMAYREAAHQWDRAASREPPGKRRSEYEEHAVRNRELADSGDEESNGHGRLTEQRTETSPSPKTSRVLN